MKRILVFSISLLCLFGGLGYAQNSEVKATRGEAKIALQGSYTPSFETDGSNAKVRNVILLIGDGMGVGAVNSAMYANGGELTMTNLKTVGFVRTQSANRFTTDSAASGTAYATGKKTDNGRIGMSSDGQQALPNLPEKLTPLGYVCGVISTDDLNGATPAVFFAHQSARGNSEAIWADLPQSKLIFASAGSQKVYEMLPLKTQEAIADEFEVVYSPDESSKISDSEKLLYLPKSVKLDRGDYLPKTTEMAIEYLSQRAGKKGFFLMVEGARIDKEAHSNNYEEWLKETLDFDKAVEAAVRFAEKDGHTLVVISADHETGGAIFSNARPEEGFAEGVFVSRGHTPMMVPLFAYGPHSQVFMGVQENSDVSNKIYSVLAGKKAVAK